MALFDKACRFAGVSSDQQREAFQFCYDWAKQTMTDWDVPDLEGDARYDLTVAQLAAWKYDNRGAGGDDAAIPQGYIQECIALRSRKDQT